MAKAHWGKRLCFTAAVWACPPRGRRWNAALRRRFRSRGPAASPPSGSNASRGRSVRADFANHCQFGRRTFGRVSAAAGTRGARSRPEAGSLAQGRFARATRFSLAPHGSWLQDQSLRRNFADVETCDRPEAGHRSRCKHDRNLIADAGRPGGAGPRPAAARLDDWLAIPAQHSVISTKECTFAGLQIGTQELGTYSAR